MGLDWIQFINTTLVPVALMLIMFSLGLTLALRDFGMVLRQPLLVGAGFGTHLFILPVLGLALLLSWAVPWFLERQGAEVPGFRSRTSTASSC